MKWLLVVLLMVSVVSSQTLIGSILKYARKTVSHFWAEPKDTRHLLHDYDFIIVGAGSAGCVLANRLTENPEWNVLLIEAGDSEQYHYDIPLLANHLQSLPEINWDYTGKSNGKYCLGMENQECKIPRGKVLGGSSVLNNMMYIRGNRRDYDNWAALNNPGWSFEEVLPYFKKIEDFRLHEYFDPYYRSKGGMITASYSQYRSKISDAAVDAEISRGQKHIDYNAESQIGVSHIQFSITNGTKDTTSIKYLHPLKHRKNFHLLKNSLVTKILIHPETLQTYGLQFVKNGRKYTVYSRKEVIVSGGAINSPQLLMLSGIGPKNHLKLLDIPVLMNLKVFV